MTVLRVPPETTASVLKCEPSSSALLALLIATELQLGLARATLEQLVDRYTDQGWTQRQTMLALRIADRWALVDLHLDSTDPRRRLLHLPWLSASIADVAATADHDLDARPLAAAA